MIDIMVSVGTRLFVGDNSGALLVECIKILGHSGQLAKIGDILVVAVKKARHKRKVKRHDVRRCLLVRQRQRTVRKSGAVLHFFVNTVVLLDQRGTPLGSRFFGAAPQELRGKKFMKLITLAHSVI